MTSAPSIRIVPAVGISNPAIIRSVVVFPHPLGPRNDTNSPRWTSSSKCSTAVESANFFCRPWISSMPMWRPQCAPTVWPGARRPRTWMSPMHAHVIARVMIASADGSYARFAPMSWR